jgi:hypothetical protein
MKETISTMLVMEKNLRGRLNELSSLASSSTTRSSWGDSARIDEPTYDVKKLDKKCSDIRKALFMIDKEIKIANSKITVDIDVDYFALMDSID